MTAEPEATTGRCATCKHWNGRRGPAVGLGDCVGVDERNGQEDPWASSGEWWPIQTRSDFGCILHEPEVRVTLDPTRPREVTPMLDHAYAMGPPRPTCTDPKPMSCEACGTVRSISALAWSEDPNTGDGVFLCRNGCPPSPLTPPPVRKDER